MIFDKRPLIIFELLAFALNLSISISLAHSEIAEIFNKNLDSLNQEQDQDAIVEQLLKLETILQSADSVKDKIYNLVTMRYPKICREDNMITLGRLSNSELNQDTKKLIFKIQMKMLSKCELEFQSLVMHGVNRLKTGTREDIGALKNSICIANDAFEDSQPFYTIRSLIMGTFNYLSSRPCFTSENIREGVHMDRSVFDQLFHTYLTKNCLEFVDKMKFVSDIYMNIGKRYLLNQVTHSYVQGQIYSMDICINLLAKTKEISGQIYELIEKHEPQIQNARKRSKTQLLKKYFQLI